MSQRFHLGSVSRNEGTLWFTLVMENTKDFYVELYNDTCQPFVKERLKTFRIADFDQYEINGVALKKLVADKMQELKTVGLPKIFLPSVPPTLPPSVGE